MTSQTAAKATTYHGISFPSKAEGQRYLYLISLLEQGELLELKVAAKKEVPHFVLLPNFAELDGTKHRAITYTPDFLYRYAQPERHDAYGRVWHVDEVKGRKFYDYPLRMKLLRYHYPQFVFHEIAG